MKKFFQSGDNLISITSFFTMTTLCFLLGCQIQYTSPPPTIVVNSQETTESVIVTITYSSYSQRPTVVCLQNSKEIQDYKKQLQFALLKIEEAESKVKVYEDQSNSTNLP